MSQSRFVRQSPNRFKSQGRHRSLHGSVTNLATIPKSDRIPRHRALDRCPSRDSDRHDLSTKSASNKVLAVNVKVVTTVVDTIGERVEGIIQGMTGVAKRVAEMATRAGSLMRIGARIENSPALKLRSRALRLVR
jgi:hypothetical protein